MAERFFTLKIGNHECRVGGLASGSLFFTEDQLRARLGSRRQAFEDLIKRDDVHIMEVTMQPVKAVLVQTVEFK